MITLAPMSEADYQAFLERLIPEYAADKVRAGNWNEAEALERSRQDMEKYLPRGIHTEGNFVGNLLNENDEPVGVLWYARLEDRPGTAFIFEFEIHASFRRRGFATQALAALETHARSRGFKRLELHVFGYNTAARDLYKKAGYIETNVNMAREL